MTTKLPPLSTLLSTVPSTPSPESDSKLPLRNEAKLLGPESDLNLPLRNEAKLLGPESDLNLPGHCRLLGDALGDGAR